MRFPAFQTLEEVAVADTPAVVVETIEEVVVAKATPQPTEYEVLRANAITERERASQAKLERVLDYTKQTMFQPKCIRSMLLSAESTDTGDTSHGVSLKLYSVM